MSFPKTVKVLKPYYNKYAYRIKYHKLDNFNSNYLQHSLGVLPLDDKQFMYYWAKYYIDEHYPSTQKEYSRRKDVSKELSMFDELRNDQHGKRLKISHGRTCTTVYFRDEHDYCDAKEIGVDLQLERNIPIISDIIEVNSSLGRDKELKRSLYYGEYRYRIDIDNINISVDKMIEFVNILDDMDDIRVNNPLLELVDQKKLLWFYYRRLSIYCRNEDATSYVLFIGGEFIKHVKQAVLIDEL